MNITIKLFASFRLGRFKAEDRMLPDGTTLGAVVAGLGLQENELGIVLLNGRHAPLARELREGDVLSLFPLLGGG